MGFPSYIYSDPLRSKVFYLHPDGSDREISVVTGGVETIGSGYSIERKDFPYVTFEMVAAGKGDLVLNGQHHPISTGVVFVYHPGVPHRIDVKHDEMTKYFVNFYGPKAEQLMSSIIAKHGYIFSIQEPLSLIQSLDTLIENGQEGATKCSQICALLGEFLLLKIEEKSFPLRDRRDESFNRYHRYRTLITQRFLELQSLQDIAVECGTDSARRLRSLDRTRL